MVFKGDKYRISVLTDRLIRLEYSRDGKFEDRPTFAVINRSLSEEAAKGLKDFDTRDTEDGLQIETEYLSLTYDKKEFSSLGLKIRLKETGNIWNYGEAYDDWSNLGGTARTLDDADGRVRLEKGIFGKNGYAVIDDSKSPVLENGEFVKRTDNNVDLYFFGYGRDYYGGLRDFCRLCGKMPMIPRYALGNWWSRYYKYTEESYLEVMDNFAKEEIPLSVAVIDMDWHLTEVDPKYGSGWTGYTWNEALFPDYKRFLKKLHDKKLSVTLNLHPADGIRPFEAMFEDMRSALKDSKGKNGGDSEGAEPIAIEFDFGDKDFREAYFETVMHPYERDGVDFWWIDWQQGTGKKAGDVDPLLLLNHYHYKDQEKRNLRPMIFSRYAGVGSHRYPVGFSGDTHVTWKSLGFQPYFTSTASNIGYGMWSHDIGGHMLGDKNLDRLIRWIEYGVFSPIMRIHSSNSPFFNKEPWLLEEPYRGIVKKFMRLRHGLIPYLYTENHRAYEESKPLVRPMYYEYSEMDDSYDVPDQYKFGENLLVSAVTGPDDEKLRLGCTRAIIPEGRWYDIFNGRIYQGKGTKKLYRKLSEIPVLLPAGGIVPLAKEDSEDLNETGNPKAFKILVGGGDSGKYTLYEDDGISMDYKEGAFATTDFEVSFDEAKGNTVFTIHPANGDTALLPEKRSYELEFYGIEAKAVKVNGKESSNISLQRTGYSVVVELPEESVTKNLVVELTGVKLLENDYRELTFEILDRAWIKTTDKDAIYRRLMELDREPFAKWLDCADISENLKSAIKEIL